MPDFTLDVSTLSGTNLHFVEAPFAERGRSIQIEWSQSGSNQDIEIHGYAVRAVPAEPMAQQAS